MSNGKKQTMKTTAQTKKEADSTSGEVFIAHLKSASTVVRSWPAWKQKVLGGSSPNIKSGKASKPK